jgi:hypothetical protein
MHLVLYSVAPGDKNLSQHPEPGGNKHSQSTLSELRITFELLRVRAGTL